MTPMAIAPFLTALPVLVVDDNAVNRHILSAQLAGFGLDPTAVDGGGAAIEALRRAEVEGRPFKLLMLDARMPSMDGFAVAEQIADRPELAGCTIMMLTSGGQHGDVERCRALNIAAYLTKPISPDHLFDAICRVLGPNVPAAAAVTPRSASGLGAAVRRQRVLLAEDNVVNQKVAVGLLSKRGHEVTVAANGREALDALTQSRFDVVLMDVQMPVMSGLEATSEIRRRESGTGGRTRIIAMTAHTMAGDRESCLDAGMDGYVSKPVKPAELFAAVEDCGDVSAVDAA